MFFFSMDYGWLRIKQNVVKCYIRRSFSCSISLSCCAIKDMMKQIEKTKSTKLRELLLVDIHYIRLFWKEQVIKNKNKMRKARASGRNVGTDKLYFVFHFILICFVKNSSWFFDNLFFSEQSYKVYKTSESLSN